MTGNGIDKVEAGIPFQILVENAGYEERCLLPNQQVATNNGFVQLGFEPTSV